MNARRSMIYPNAFQSWLLKVVALMMAICSSRRKAPIRPSDVMWMADIFFMGLLMRRLEMM